MLLLMPQDWAISPERLLAALLVIVVALATYAMYARSLNHVIAAAFFLPQQTLLLVTSIGALHAIFTGHYADGYAPYGGGWFISTDQITRVLLAPLYTVGLIARVRVIQFGRR